jgi:hypothetical protein
VLESGVVGFVKEQFFRNREDLLSSQTRKTTYSKLTFDEVKIIRPHHPLYGQIFPVLETSGYKDKRYYILELPEHSPLRIPVEWTCHKDLPMPQATPEQPVCTVKSLQAVLSILTSLKNKANMGTL